MSDGADSIMSGVGATPDRAVSGAAVGGDLVVNGSAPGGDRTGAGASRALLLVLEPSSADTPAGAALLSEGSRLATQLDCEVKAVTWNNGESRETVSVGAIAGVLADYAHVASAGSVLLPDSDVARELAPVLAERLGCGAVLGCADIRIDGAEAVTFVKPVYGGWLEQDVRPAAGMAAVATLDLSGIEVPATAVAEAPAVETLDPPAIAEAGSAAETKVHRLELLPPDAKSVDLVHAKRIVSAGMGAADEELLAGVRELADLLDGSVGATRPMVDEGRLPKERLIGQTGRTVSPELYVALGLSGSPHHVAGVRKADTIVAVNRDPRAPIFQFSDVGYVADLRAVLPALIERIKEWRDAGE